MEKITKLVRSRHFKLIAVSMTIAAWMLLLLNYSERLAQLTEHAMRFYIS